MSSTPDWKTGAVYLRSAAPELIPYLDTVGVCDLKPKPETAYFATLITGIVAQQLPPKVSLELMQKLTEAVGGALTPESILAVSEEKLIGCGLVAQKVKYAKDFAKLVQEKKIDFAAFQDMQDGQIVKLLTAVRGLGQWTVEMFLLLSLCRADVFPADDYLLKKAVQKIFKLQDLPKRGQIIKLIAPWKPWRGLAAWYLWHNK
jgi:DNA-3-methyladenine glycosylase II